MGHVPDFPLILVGMITAAVIIWRDRTSSWQTVVAGLLLTLMIAWSGHDDVLIGIALVLVAVTLAQAIRGGAPTASERREPSVNASAVPVVDEAKASTVGG